jgi:lipid II:glycine glycyltransferase (peptidoglycan interpeptide bridge formation enzyme)
MIITRRGPLKIAELWFDEPLRGKHVDIARFIQRTDPLLGAASQPKHTIVIDLRADEEELFASIKKDTRGEIRRARDKDGVSCRMWTAPTSQLIREFCEFYRGFAAQKGLEPIAAAYLHSLCQNSALALSQARERDAKALVWHSYVCVDGRARLLKSASQFRAEQDAATRNAVGRANRFLHWADILAFKETGCAVYDLGGWYSGCADEQLVRINRFKEEFGGRKVTNYNCELAMTLLGRCAQTLKRWRTSRMGRVSHCSFTR